MMWRYPLSLPKQLKIDAESVAEEQGVSLNQFILWAVAEKIGALRQDMGDPEFPHITYRRPAGGRPTPVMRANGVRVQSLVVAATRWGMEPAKIAEEYELPTARVSEALAFYEAHRDEVEALIADDEAAEAAHA